MIEIPDTDEKLGYCIGGLCGLALGIGYVIIIVLYAPIGAPPVNIDALLRYLGTNPSRWWWIIGLSVLTYALFLPVAMSVYSALRTARRYLVCLAVAFILLFVFLDLAITWTNYASLVALKRQLR